MGISTSNICNAVRMDDGKPYKPTDFMPDYDRDASKEMSESDSWVAKAKLAGWNAAESELKRKREGGT